MNKIKKRSDCPISSSLDIWGDRWSLLIVRDLMFTKESTYGGFLKSAEGIATNILASRLLCRNILGTNTNNGERFGSIIDDGTVM